MRAMIVSLLFVGVAAAAIALTRGHSQAPVASAPPSATPKGDAPPAMDVALFGGGCFWCIEAVFQDLKGVQSVTSGYSGGAVKNPTYRDVCTGLTGHAEVVRIVYDPKIISYDELLEVFWFSHDPTTRNRQGGDVGPQYRSVVFYTSDKQKTSAEDAKRLLNEKGGYRGPIVTEIEPASAFYPAEAYHQDFFANNQNHPNCQFVIQPKVKKLRDVFPNLHK